MISRILAVLLLAILIVTPSVVFAGARAKTAMVNGAKPYPPNAGDVCILTGPPPADVKYEVLARIVATKRTYGGVDELFLPMLREARLIGADAIINLKAGQRFKGPLPWRITSPTGDGQAIKVLPESPSLDCTGIGGDLWGLSGRIEASSARNIEVSDEQAPEKESSGSDGNGPEREKAESAARRTDFYEELLELDDLRQRGILTESEFQSEKAKLLERN